MSNTIFFADNENFKNRNFPMLHRLIREFGFEPIFDDPPKPKDISFFLKGLDINLGKNIKENRYLYNIDLFEIVGPDYRKYINSRSLNEPLNFTWDDILSERFDALDKQATKELINKLNNTQACIEYYRDKLFAKRPIMVFVFGGSKIYQRACLKICELYNLNTFVLEHFFTGKHVYIEPQFNQIHNNKDTIKRIHARAKKNTSPITPINLQIFNLNVKDQPNTDYVDEIFASMTAEKIGCVFLQVFDDYSLTNVSNDFILARELDRILGLALNENDRLLLKLHPFEKIKHGTYPTKLYLENKFSEEIKRGRVYIIEGMCNEQISRINNWYGIVSQYALNLNLLGIEPNLNDNFFFNELFETHDPYDKAILIHEIAECGYFNKTEESFEKFVDHVAENLLPSIGCNEADIEEFYNKSFSIKKAGKVILNTQIIDNYVTNNKKTSEKIRNSLRLLLTDPRSFKIKLFAKLGL